MFLSNQQNPKLDNWLTKNFRKAEIMLLIILGSGLILKFLGLKIGEIAITISISTLAVFYFWNAYLVYENAKPVERLFAKLLPFGWSISIMGVQFMIMGWPGFEPMLIIGSLPLFVSLIIIVILKEKRLIDSNTLDKSKLVRTFIIATLAISLHFCPKEILFKYHLISKQQVITQNKNAP